MVSVSLLALISSLLVIDFISCGIGSVSGADLNLPSFCNSKGNGEPNIKKLLKCNGGKDWKSFKDQCQVATGTGSLSSVCQVLVGNKKTSETFPITIFACSGGCPANSACTVDPTFLNQACTSLFCLNDVFPNKEFLVSVSTCQLLTTTTTTTQTTTSATASIRP